ncbi:response regulator [Engelhardtia mirabilis]|uniref:histidine kinase n=1 Tax=Engelhardtia mirabilis TaxID=2528011 RepID=A0A518BMC3_9BACT|nr:Signal transduction histidine-protein kinase BarA [Planctomycetes bacterium Pla133]QDV02439.1 Signal transduction histidine-protein kinase BarA [Planctomycetes bacterium Pla86]
MIPLPTTSASNVRPIYLLPLALIAALVLATLWIVQMILQEGAADAELINLSGRQRMLSQRIAKDAMALALSRSDLNLDPVESGLQLEQSIGQFNSAQVVLLEHIGTSSAIRHQLQALEPLRSELIAAARQIVERADGADTEVGRVRAVLDRERAFLPRMQAVVRTYQAESEARLARLERVVGALAAMILLTLVLEVLLVFEPQRLLLREKVRDLTRAREQALEGARAKDEFLATMSHEIRTPLNGVIGMTELMLEGELSTDQRELAETAGRSGEALLAIVNDVLDVAKLSAGGVNLESVPFSLGELLSDTFAAVASGLEGRTVELIVEQSEDLPDGLQGDPTRLRQVLTNLVGNAIKFTELGHVLVRATERRSGDGARELLIQVKDTGIGIPEHRLGHVFDRFSQADSSTTRRFGGTGLGLAIVRDLVQMMGGTVEVRSTLGVGTTFTVVLPLLAAHQPLVEGDEAPNLGGRRVVVVDDHPVNARVLTGHVESIGGRVTSYLDPRDALEALAACDVPPDAIVLDHQMPGMDGVELACRLRALPGFDRVPVVLASSLGGAQIPDPPGGWAARLVKPLLRRSVHRVLCGLLCSEVADRSDQVKVALPALGRMDPAGDSGLRVLVAEDNPVNTRLIVAHLRALGCSFETVEDGACAVERAAAGPYDVILMDCQMPILDGYEAARRIRQLPGHGSTPIVALTAGARAEDRHRSADAGMEHHLSKPYRREDLRRVLERACDLHCG